MTQIYYSESGKACKVCKMIDIAFRRDKSGFAVIIQLVLKGVALAMGVAVVVLSTMNKIDMDSAVGMLGMGLACLAVIQISVPS